jgi:hypothetical protein
MPRLAAVTHGRSARIKSVATKSPPNTCAATVSFSVDQQYVECVASVQYDDSGEHTIRFVVVTAIPMPNRKASMKYNPILHTLSCIIRKSITHTEALIRRFA